MRKINKKINYFNFSFLFKKDKSDLYKAGISLIFTVLFLILASPQMSLATIYQPGETLEPDCAPGSANCGVGVFSLNSQAGYAQVFSTGVFGTDFNIVSDLDVHTFNFPDASALSRGLLTSVDWDIFNNKQSSLGYTPLDAANNLSDLADTGISRTNLGLGTLSTQDGTFSGVSSGTNTGDQTISGTTDRVSVVNGDTNPVIDIAATYVGQSSITTLGTIDTGVWNGTTIAVNRGGTGSTNGSITSASGTLSFTSASFNTLSIDSGTTGAINIGTGTNGVGKQISIGNTNGSTLLNLNAGLGGIYLTGVAAASAGHVSVCIDSSTNQLFLGATDATCNPSSVQYKHDIADINLGLDAVNTLRPVSYIYNSNNQAALGFIAEEAALVDERLIARDKGGVIQAINPNAFTPILTHAIQEISVLLGDVSPKVDGSDGNNGLSTLIAAIQSENAHDPITVITQKVSDGKQFLADFVVARLTAIRGYFDEVFAKKIHTEQICVNKSDGNEVCINGDKLDSLLQNVNIIPVVNPPLNNNDAPADDIVPVLQEEEVIVPTVSEPIPAPDEVVVTPEPDSPLESDPLPLESDISTEAEMSP